MIKLPHNKPLSWSSMSLWERCPQQWIDHYIHGKPMFETDEMRFGKKIHKCISDGFSDEEEIDDLIVVIPRRTKPDFEMIADLDGIPLRGFLDFTDEIGFEEYKTGSDPWDQRRAENHGQMDFYSLLWHLNNGCIPDQNLHWLPTVKQGRNISLTGELHSFKVVKTLEHLEAMKKRIKKNVAEILNYKKFEKKVIKI